MIGNDFSTESFVFQAVNEISKSFAVRELVIIKVLVRS